MRPKAEGLNIVDLTNNPRADLASWMKYESLILTAYRAFPSPYEFKPKNHSAHTVVSRFRDATRGCIAFQHPITLAEDITHDMLRDWYLQVIIKRNADDTIFVGRPEKRLIRIETERLPDKDSYTYASLTYEEISAFSLLLATGRIRGPVKALAFPDVTTLPERSNLNVMVNSDGALVLY